LVVTHRFLYCDNNGRKVSPPKMADIMVPVIPIFGIKKPKKDL
jgi:hypothetical protein